MLFHLVASVLLTKVAFSTFFSLVKILLQPIRIFEIGGYFSCHRHQNEGYYVKERKNLIKKHGVESDLSFCLRRFIVKTISDMAFGMGKMLVSLMM